MSVLVVAARSALACSFAPPATLAIDPTIPDDTPPAPPEVTDVEVSRGRGDDGAACEPFGWLTITVARPADDPDPEDEVGYRLARVDGALPDGLDLGSAPLLGSGITLIWTDGGPPHRAFDATLSLTPVDLAGNEGAPVEVAVGDPGDGCGCGSNRTAPTARVWLLVVGAFVAGRVRDGSRRIRAAT